MYIIATLLFLLGIILGGVYGYARHLPLLEMIIAIGVGGFIGSAAGGLVFTYLYLRSAGEDDKAHEKDLSPLAQPTHKHYLLETPEKKEE